MEELFYFDLANELHSEMGRIFPSKKLLQADVISLWDGLIPRIYKVAGEEDSRNIVVLLDDQDIQSDGK